MIGGRIFGKKKMEHKNVRRSIGPDADNVGLRIKIAAKISV